MVTKGILGESDVRLLVSRHSSLDMFDTIPVGFVHLPLSCLILFA